LSLVTVLIHNRKLNEDAFDFNLKIMLVGDSLCGKTHLLTNFVVRRYLYSQFASTNCGICLCAGWRLPTFPISR